MHTIHFCFFFFQEKFAQISRELPQAVGAGCEVRMNGLGYSVQRPKGDTGEPTVGDTALSCLKSIVCIPCFRRCKHGQASEGKLESAPAGWVMLCTVKGKICTYVVYVHALLWLPMYERTPHAALLRWLSGRSLLFYASSWFASGAKEPTDGDMRRWRSKRLLRGLTCRYERTWKSLARPVPPETSSTSSVRGERRTSEIVLSGAPALQEPGGFRMNQGVG